MSGFEDALVRSRDLEITPAVGRLVSIGSGHSYRNVCNLLKGFRTYRAAGGRLDLWVAGPPGSARGQRATERAAAGISGVTVTWRSLSRAECLAALGSAAAVILPSRVEASPLAALEAVVANENVVLSDIIGHREILGEFGKVSPSAFFDPTSSDDIAKSLGRAESSLVSSCHDALADSDVRERARERWGDRVSAWLARLPAKESDADPRSE